MDGRSRLILPQGYQSVPDRAVLYCDESGNSGPNYLDGDQPFYVLAGWVVPDRSNVKVWVAVEGLRQRVSPQSEELKSRALLRDERRKREAASLLAQLGSLGAIPLYLIAEKRFCVAAKIVETFLDPFYNPKLRNGITGDFETKKEIANQLYDRLPDSVLVQFAKAYHRPDGRSLKGALSAVADASRDKLSPELAEALLGSSSKIDEIAEAEASSSLLGNVGASLNLPCLVSFLMMVEALGRVGLHQPIRFVHDQQHAYEAGYRKIFELHRGMPRLFSAPTQDGLPFGRLETVAEFETSDSKSCLGIQAADALAGVINHLMQIAMGGNEPSAADIELARLTMPGLLVPGIKVACPLWSDRCMVQVGGSLVGKLIHPPANSEEETRRARAVENARTAPVLPPVGPTPGQQKRFKPPWPVFALRLMRSSNLLVLSPDVRDVESGGKEHSVIPMFSTKARASSFLATLDRLAEEHRVVAFDDADTFQLVEQLDYCAQVSEWLVFDPMTETMAHVYLPSFLESLRAKLHRMKRLLGSGLDRVVLQRTHVKGGRQSRCSFLTVGTGPCGHPSVRWLLARLERTRSERWNERVECERLRSRRAVQRSHMVAGSPRASLLRRTQRAGHGASTREPSLEL